MRLRQELATNIGVTPRIRWGDQGQLDVIADGRVVFSKQEAGRLPTDGEVTRLLTPS